MNAILSNCCILCALMTMMFFKVMRLSRLVNDELCQGICGMLGRDNR